MRNHNNTTLLAFVTMLAFASSVVGFGSRAHADSESDIDLIRTFVASNSPEVVAGVVRSGVLSVNEGTWNVVDTAAITHIRMRYAEAHGLTLNQALMRLHGSRSLRPDRAVNVARNDARPWIGDLSADLHEPRGWRQRCTTDRCTATGMPDWETVGKRQWARVLATAIRVYMGRQADPCHGPNRAITWGGPGVDHLRIARMTAGGYARVHCPGSANIFLSRR